MAKAAKARWSERLYSGGHRLLHRAHLNCVLDYHWCELLLSAQPGPLPSAWDASSLWLGEVRPPQLAWLQAFAPDRVEAFPARWANGCRCFAAALEPARNQRCVGYLWVVTGPARLASASGYDWDLPNQAAWIFDALFHPLVLGTYPDLVRFTTAQLRHEGFPLMLGQVEYDNRLSRRVHRMLGGKRLGWIATLRLAGLTAHLDRRPGSWALHWGRTPVPLAVFLPSPAAAAADASAA